jgi:hypothetical protein
MVASPTPAAPRLSALRVSPSSASIAGRLANGHCSKPTSRNKRHKSCRRAIKLHISYSLTTAADVTFTLKRQDPGRKVNGRCVKPTHKNRKHPRCTRSSRVSGTLTQHGAAGGNTFTFNGKIGGHTLGRGSYQLTGVADGGNAQKFTFRIT